MKTSIVLFKTNLRLEDNKPLLEAVSNSESIIPLYVLDSSSQNLTQFGTQKMGNFRLKFLIESLQDLDQSLREIGSGLLFEQGITTEIISNLITKYGVKDIYMEEAVAFEERKFAAEIEKMSWSKKCIVHTHETSTLFETKDLPFPLKLLPDVFTKFRTIIEKECLVKATLSKPEKIVSPRLKAFDIPLEIQSKIERITSDERSAFPFLGGSKSAKERLNFYFFESNQITKYKETRNELIGVAYSSKFSPWLAFGCISPKEIVAQLNNYEQNKTKNESTYWLYFELLWREYFHWVMRKYDFKLFSKNGIKHIEPVSRSFNQELFDQWKNGETGNDFVDANMRELNATGFMSNRGRQNVASFLCNDLKQDWRFGAAYFEEQLIDYDVCSNWGNWAYIAGVGNDPRGHRVFNVEKQAKDYDSNYKYRKLWNKR